MNAACDIVLTNPSVFPSVCSSVRHILVLYLKECTYHQTFHHLVGAYPCFHDKFGKGGPVFVFFTVKFIRYLWRKFELKLPPSIKSCCLYLHVVLIQVCIIVFFGTIYRGLKCLIISSTSTILACTYLHIHYHVFTIDIMCDFIVFLYSALFSFLDYCLN